jgi:heme-degrading monooxygenase HmoA
VTLPLRDRVADERRCVATHQLGRIRCDEEPREGAAGVGPERWALWLLEQQPGAVKGEPPATARVRWATLAYDFRVSVVKINAITVPRERFDEFERRFAARAGRVSSAPGFESFELLRPNDDREVCLVVTRWRSEEDFQSWVSGPDFAAGHAQHRQDGPVGTASEIWSFEVLETEAPARAT